jgi:hypothetical protein
LWISPRDPRRVDVGLMLGAQVKNGESWFSEAGEKDGRTGWWHRNNRQHFDYWIHHAVPHILVLRHPDTQQAYWAHVNPDTVEWTGRAGKIFVPEDQVLDSSALRPLTDIAAMVRPAPRWAGTAWKGARDLAPADAYRHALLAPRLVAPHPNAGVRALEAPEAIALLAAGRFGELDRYGLIDQDASRSGWSWDFFGALLEFVTSGSVDALRACVTSATQPYESAAAAAALSAALAEDGAYDQALEILREPLDTDRCAPIDHAWLELHRARCLAELGDPAAAIDLGISVQRLPTILPDDVTAAAIAGSGASLVFRTSNLFEGDVATTITASDTESSWWRAQAVSWGLSSMFDESFRRWTRNDNEFRFGYDSPTYRLRGVSLVDGFTALHESWCSTTSLLARWELMSGNLSVTAAHRCLTDLRRAGDVKAVAAAVAHLLEAGPAKAVRDAADLIDLDRVTHTEAGASLELLVTGADVLSTATADGAARWAMLDAADLDAWVQRVRPAFIVEYRCAALLRALLPVVSPATSSLIREYVVSLPQLSDQGAAHAWAAVISAVPGDDWTADQGSALLHRAGDHWELENAVKAIGVLRDPAWREANEDALRSGSIEALTWVGQITNVPTDAVVPLVTALAHSIRDRLTQVRGGMHALHGGVDPGRALVLMNTHFLDDADWEPIIELLTEPLADTNLLNEAISSIEWHADRIDDSTRVLLVDALTAMLERRPLPALSLIGGDPRPAARSALEALAPESISVMNWISIRDRPARQQMVLALARRADPGDTKTLVALAADPDPRIRATVAAALSRWVIKDVSTATALDALAELLKDDGTLVARRAVGSWRDEPGERLLPLARLLEAHPSAAVRAQARRILSLNRP